MYWTHSTSHPNILDRKIPDHVVEFLHEHRGICAVILAQNLKVAPGAFFRKITNCIAPDPPSPR
jgi:hypothetical protein